MSPQFPMPCPTLLADVSVKEGPRSEILQSAARLFQGISEKESDLQVIHGV